MEQLIRKQGGEPFVAPSMREIPLADNDRSLRFRRTPLRRRVRDGDPADRSRHAPIESPAGHALSRGRLRRGPGTRDPGGARTQARGRPARYGPEAGHRGAGTEYLAGTPGGDRRHGPSAASPCRNTAGPPTNCWTGCARAAPKSRRFASTSGTCRRMSSPCAKRRAASRRAPSTSSLFTTAIQIAHLARVAARTRHRGCRARTTCASARSVPSDPTTTEALEEFGVHPLMEPSHPKMGFLVKEAAERARQ